jgi:hypothetical protein
MQYPALQAAGSMLSPKLLGTYESKISDIFTQYYISEFEIAFDISCAKEYYAVGLAVNDECWELVLSYHPE